MPTIHRLRVRSAGDALKYRRAILWSKVEGGRVAELKTEGDQLVLELTAEEKLEGIHGDIRVPLSAVRSVTVVEDALGEVHGIRTGTGIPGVLVVGTIRWSGKKSFVVVHHGHPRGVVVRLEDTEFDEFVIGTDEPDAMVAQLSVLG